MPTAGGLVISCRLWYATDKGAADKRQAVSPWSGLTRSGALLALRSHERGAAAAKRILRMKQRAVAGAALRFLQAPLRCAAKTG